MEWGPLVTAAIMFLGSLCYGAVAVHTWRRAMDGRVRSLAGPTFFLLVTVFLFASALRQGLAYLVTDFAFIDGLRRALFLVGATAGGLSLVAVIHLGMVAAWGRKRRVLGITAGLFAVYGIVLYLIMWGALGHATTGPWGTSYSLGGLSFWTPLLLFMTVPAFTASLLLVYAGAKLKGTDGQRLRHVGFSCILLYGALTITASGADEAVVVISRLVIAMAALLAYHAYFPLTWGSFMPWSTEG